MQMRVPAAKDAKDAKITRRTQKNIQKQGFCFGFFRARRESFASFAVGLPEFFWIAHDRP
jgi:hypothetical protein